ncbi:MAG: aldo/keto reductase, partial [Oscillospiraceae bacterium]|nr:aldo/keto reductase [Oscillospiraceae bacterium]
EVDFVQLQINYLDWNDKNIQSKKCWEIVRKHGKNVVVMEPVKGGTLARVPEKAESLFRGIDPEMSAASWAVRFAAGLDGVMTVLSGMSDMEQLRDNIGYMEDFKPLGEAEKDAVVKAAEIIHASVAIPCTACRYCTEGCPKNIPIPEYFALYNADILALNKGFSTQTTYYDNFTRKFGKAGDCINCGQCERMCPQHLKVPELMKLVAERLEDKN